MLECYCSALYYKIVIINLTTIFKMSEVAKTLEPYNNIMHCNKTKACMYSFLMLFIYLFLFTFFCGMPLLPFRSI